MHIENNMMDVIVIDIPNVIASWLSLVGWTPINRKKGSTTVSFDSVNRCSARVIMHPLKYHCDIIVTIAIIHIKIRRGRFDGYKKNKRTHETIITGCTARNADPCAISPPGIQKNTARVIDIIQRTSVDRKDSISQREMKFFYAGATQCNRNHAVRYIIRRYRGQVPSQYARLHHTQRIPGTTRISLSMLYVTCVMPILLSITKLFSNVWIWLFILLKGNKQVV